MKRLQNAWVFVSHSTKDIDQVRRVRNEVEKQGGEPLLFFLKCIDEADELDDLLKREIRARRYFLLCNSPAASASNWVKKEVEEVRKLPQKRVETLDLVDPIPDQDAAIRRLLRAATIFPCYAAADRHIVEPLLRLLSTEEFGLFDPREAQVRPLEEAAEEIESAIDQSRYFLDFLSARSLASPWCRLERQRFQNRIMRESTRESARESVRISVMLDRGILLEENLPRLHSEAIIDYTREDREAFATRLREIMYG